ncbi:DUF2599 domain-containing protein [Gordonia sp. HNM0687]|uniref:DUF2599 domain-containing protein n=1 Tax=Gordonia mangrovi TaxID=2665643 RepID=A0A6L7GL57_9ACTN|nr:DUF2599 domain-containing protein [Gordonia mangrovi]MXP19981.1 DUF2599 domain-containing protein [Gordonia mangrovi]UVF79402.1 DUF2599 domain-containing protein [Gordonia mangrovi]
MVRPDDLATAVRRAGALTAAVLLGATLSGCAGTDDAPPPSSSTASATTQTTVPVTSTPVTATPVLPPPYVDHATWVDTAVGPSLQIVPTPAGRRTENPTGDDIAWAEVLQMVPGADTPGMRAQFDCHWDFARLVEPDKPSWNIEPQRPVVTDDVMISTRCNPGFAEE